MRQGEIGYVLYVFNPHFAFLLYLIFKVYLCRDKRPAVCNIIVQIFFSCTCGHECAIKDRLPVDLISHSCSSSSHFYLVSSEDVRTGPDTALLGNQFSPLIMSTFTPQLKVARVWFHYTSHTPPTPPLPRHDSMNLSTHNISVYSHGTTKSIQLSLRILWKSLTERVVLGILVFWRTFVCRSVAIYHFGLTFLSTEVASMTPQKAVHKILAHFYVFTFVEIWFVADIDSTLKNRFRSGVTSVALLGAWWSQFRSVILSTIL